MPTAPPPQYHQQATHPALGRHTKGEVIGLLPHLGVYVTEQDTPPMHHHPWKPIIILVVNESQMSANVIYLGNLSSKPCCFPLTLAR